MARFTRRARLLKPDEFKFVFENGRREQTPLFTAIAASNTVGQARLGLAIAKKNIAKANDRNRVKRHIRESFRYHQDDLPQVDIVILTRPAAQKETAAGLRLQLERLWTRLVAR
jgi:ribonuclease P protein component